MQTSPQSTTTDSEPREQPLRYERKARIEEIPYYLVEHQVRTHPALFREIYHQRWINNVYWDTFDLESFEENISGSQDRSKLRVRWYGDMFGKAEKPVLEVKFKTSVVGGKHRFALSPMTLAPNFTGRQLQEWLDRQDLPGSARAALAAQEPRLLNRYSRRYFETQDRRFRLTLDRQLDYYRLHQGRNLLLQKVSEPDTVVLELKYDVADDRQADDICSHFPFLLTKNSKYVTGVERLYWKDSP